MQLIKTSRLTGRQVSEINQLILDCKALHPIQLSFPFEDGSVFFLAYEYEQEGTAVLASVLALIMPNMEDSDDTFECLAFTRPLYRGKGYFSALFEAAEDLFEDVNLLFPCDGKDEDAILTLKSLGAEFDSCEYKMELSLSDEETADAPGSNGRLSCRTRQEDDGSTAYTFFLSEDDSRPAAVCRTAAFGSKICFYGFLVDEALRGQGIGREALLTVVRTLRRQKAASLFLHVSGGNQRAVNLYKKTGFRITETLSYYLY